MKKAKVIKKKETGVKSLFGGRGWVLAVCVFLLLLLLATAMPMANIPGFSRLAGLLGLSPDSMRYLTLSDLAAYAAGVDGNRVSAAQSAYGGYTAYDFRGGLSAVTMAGGSRLLDAQEAYRREYEMTGKYPRGIAGPLSKYQTPTNDMYYDGVGLYSANGSAPIIDPERVGPGGEYGPGFGSPLGGSAGAYGNLGPLPGQVDALRPMVKPVSPFDIAGASRAEDGVDKLIESSASKMRGGRLGTMGGFNALVSRINPRLGGMGQYGAFGDVGRSYFFSYSAGVTGYKTTAKQLAEAAFDGSEMETETIIIPGETEERVIDTLEPPSSIVNKFNSKVNACNKAKKEYQSQIENLAKEIRKIVEQDLGHFNYKYNRRMPGNCKSSFWHPTVVKQRAQWNGHVDVLVAQCEAIIEMRKSMAGKCGITATTTSTTCSSLTGLKALGGKKGPWGACRYSPKMQGNLAPECASNKKGGGNREICIKQMFAAVSAATELDFKANETFWK